MILLSIPRNGYHKTLGKDLVKYDADSNHLNILNLRLLKQKKPLD